MIRDDIKYHRPDEISDVCRILADSNRAVVLGGGTTLVPRLTRGVDRASDIVDLRGLGLSTVEVYSQEVRLGAMATYRSIMRAGQLPGPASLLNEVAAVVTGGNQIRNLGTIAGSAAYANPASDVPAALVAMSAQLRLVGVHGAREVEACDFFTGANSTRIASGEFLHSISIPIRSAAVGYYKVKAGAGGWPVVTAAAIVDAEHAAVTIGAAQDVPLTVDVSSARRGPDWDRAALEDLIGRVVTASREDIQATAVYRKRVASVVARRALERAMQ